MTSHLSSNAIETLESGLDRDGYCVLPSVVSADKLAAFNIDLLEAYEHADKFKGGGSISGHLNCYPGEGARFALDDIEAAGVGAAIRAMRSGKRNDVRATLNFNLPGSVAQHYHMDGVYTDEFVICNVAVVDTDLRNGAIDLLPTTHKEFFPFWRYALARKYRLTTRIPMRRGDLLVRRSTLWHRGTPNRSDAPRPMLSFTYGEQSAPSGDPFDGNGDIVFYPNWYAGSSAGSVLRERIEVALPITRSVARFAKSLVGRRGYASY